MNKYEEGIKNLADKISKVEELIDMLPDCTNGLKEVIKDKVLNSNELKDLIDSINNPRPPKIFMLGKTGVGKSALINAICESYVAQTNEFDSETSKIHEYSIEKDGKIIFDVIDSRGISESQAPDDTEGMTAEEQVVKDVIFSRPDILLYLLKPDRAGIKPDIDLINEVKRVYKEKYSVDLPIMVVMTHADGINPVKKSCADKIDKIQMALASRLSDLKTNGLNIKADDMLAVSSYIEWQDATGNTYSDSEDMKGLSCDDKRRLTIASDERFNIDILVNMMASKIKDLHAAFSLSVVAQSKNFLKVIARKIEVVFAGMASTVSGSDSIPFSDLPVITAIQTLMVYCIATLVNVGFSIKDAFDFCKGLLGASIAGFVGREISRALVKIIPALGSYINAAIAYGFTMAIGEAAIMHFIDEVSIDDVKNQFEELANEYIDKFKESVNKEKANTQALA